ncbi:flagellar filament capping protein FliD [Paenibacillus sp. NPDC057967]|uniref:flagellar filament capping protein FliD n=1 Tax=Paenibacillus sp. NPDC057967 TaxID=3346293 RepID=UPI0036DDF0F8
MPMRITGMSSGLDIDSMIRDIMKAERMPVNKLLQKKQTMQWKVESFNNMNLKFSALRESVSTLRFSGGWAIQLDGNGKVDKQTEDSMVAKIKNFVDKYNDTVSNLNEKLGETVNRGFLPLTSDEKSAMNETDIKNWEEKAKSGLLRNDDALKKALNELRGLTAATISGANPAYDTLGEIGISTPTYAKGSPDNGKLTIDEAKLRSAIQDDPTAVVGLFSKQGTTFEEKGVFQRAYETIENAILSVNRKIHGGLSAAESLTSQMTNIDKKVEEKNKQLVKREDRYYQMFAAMEKAIANGNAQMSWLMQQFG